MALYHQQKAALRNILNECIRSGRSAEDTKLLLRLTKNNMCNQCYLHALASGYGRAFCDRADACFLEEAVKTYCEVADKKCVPTEPNTEM